MKSFLKGRMLVRLVCALCCICLLAGCGRDKNGKNFTGEMTEDNPLYALEEVRELNANLEAPFMLGASEKEVSDGGYELMDGGIEHHIRNYRSKTAHDVFYTLGTRELHYGEPDAGTKLYVTRINITFESKTIEKNADGSTRPVYVTSRSVFGIRVGDNIEEARKKLAAFGYETVYEEAFGGGLPKKLDNTYRKGAVMITLGAESGGGDISQINIWLPYNEPAIDALNEKSLMPVDLGNMYSIMMNPSFSYVQNSKASGSRLYTSDDGSTAVMRGFPDVKDIAMTAEVSFISDKYNVLGVKVGMSEDEAKALLIAGGCTEDEDGYFIFNSVAAVRLTSENGVVSSIAACLRPSTDLAGAQQNGG